MAANNTAIEFRITPEGAWQLIPPTYPATLLGFLAKSRGQRRVVSDDMYQALGKSPEVNARLHDLRHKWGLKDHIITEMVKKANGRGQYGVYRLSDDVEVRKPSKRRKP